jgi:hypothetical protein
MSLINCSECHKEVSSSANVCPHCGHKLKKGCLSRSLSIVFYIFVFSLFLGLIKSCDVGDTEKISSKVTECSDTAHSLVRNRNMTSEQVDSLLKIAKKIPYDKYYENYNDYCELAQGTKDDGQYELFKDKYENYKRLYTEREKAKDLLVTTCKLALVDKTDHQGNALDIKGVKAWGKYNTNQLYVDVRTRGVNAFGARVETTVRCIGNKTGIIEDIKTI